VLDIRVVSRILRESRDLMPLVEEVVNVAIPLSGNAPSDVPSPGYSSAYRINRIITYRIVVREAMG
jgi:hypothetical protein